MRGLNFITVEPRVEQAAALRAWHFRWLPPMGLPPRPALLLGLSGIACFHIAWLHPRLAGLMLPFLLALFLISQTASLRSSFYLGLAVGLACYAPHLWFFHGIFGLLAWPLWFVVALPLGCVLILSRLFLERLGHPWASAAFPILFTGLEFLRSELHPLRFAWLTPGLAFGNGWPVRVLGVYGTGLILGLLAAGLVLLPRRWMVPAVAGGVLALGAVSSLPVAQDAPPAVEMPDPLVITGIQLEGAPEREVLAALDRAMAEHPQTDLLVLPEYTLFSPPTTALRQWCAGHGRHLLVGGVEPSPDGRTYRNTAFVIDPAGEVIFAQAKAVPIQFFQDGLPAEGQEVWDSPWGKIGVLICYDLSYARVTDVVVRQGAQLLLVPTMDATGWGAYQHALHGRVAPARSAEYHLPIVRIASSGISQITDVRGRVRASAPFPGQGVSLSNQVFPAAEGGRIPPDRLLAPACTGLSAALAAGLLAFRRTHVLRSRTVSRATAAC